MEDDRSYVKTSGVICDSFFAVNATPDEEVKVYHCKESYVHLHRLLLYLFPQKVIDINCHRKLEILRM